MYGVKIGVGGTGSSSTGSVLALNKQLLDGPASASRAAKSAPAAHAAAGSLSSSSATAPPPSPGHLFSHFAAASGAPLSASDSALSHVFSVAVSSRVVPLSAVEAAEDQRRQARKLRKAERRKTERELKGGSNSEQTVDSPDAAQHADDAAEADRENNAPLPVQEHDSTEEVTAKQRKAKKKAPKVRPQLQPTPAPPLCAPSDRPLLPAPLLSIQPSLHRDDVVSLRLSSLCSLLSSLSSQAVQQTCNSLLSSALTATLPSLTARQRKELTARLQEEFASEPVCQQQLWASKVLQAAVAHSNGRATQDADGGVAEQLTGQ